MRPIYCPNCGHANDPRNHFCKQCGFNLMQYKQRMKMTNPPNPGPTGRNPNPDSQRYGMQPQPPMPPKHRHIGLITLIIIVIIALAGFGTYETNVWPFGNGPLGTVISPSHRSGSQSNSSSNTSSRSIDMSAKYDVVKNFWTHVNADVDSQVDQNSSSDFSNDFQNGSDNKAYKNMSKWCDMIRNANDDNGTSVDSITPYDFSEVNPDKVSYKVRYDFKSGSHHHIQVYSWQNKVENGKLVSMTMENHSKPLADYDKK